MTLQIQATTAVQRYPSIAIILAVILIAQLCFYAVASDNVPVGLDLKQAVENARNNGQMDRADELADQLAALASQSDNTSLQAEALYQKARNSMERNQYQQASLLLNESIALFQDIGNRKALGDAYKEMGQVYRYQANYPTALEYVYLAMQIYEELADRSAISSAYNNIGVIMEMMGQLQEASEAHNNALHIHYELNDQQGIASSLYNLGDIYRSMGDFDKAEPYLLDALKMDIEAGEPKNIAYSHNKLGYIYLQMGLLEKSKIHVDTALTLFEEIQAPRDIDWAKSILARLEYEQGNLTAAQRIINGVISRAIANGYNSLLVNAYKVAVLIAIKQENYDEALKLIEKGALQAVANEETLNQVEFEELRVEALVGKNDLRQALNALQNQNRLEDALLDSKRIDTIARIQAQADFVQQAQRIKLLENEKQLQQASIEREQLKSRMWLLLVIGSSLFVFLFYSRFNQRRLNLKLTEQVKKRTQQLEEKNLELSEAYKQMENISMTDRLTGINNRRFLEKSIVNDLSQTVRCYQDWHTGQGPEPVDVDIVFFLIDLDNFKEVNDTYGHSVGDNILQQLVKRMAGVFRQSDYLVRWGGEEFIAVARFIDRKEAPRLAQRMVDDVRNKPFSVSSDTEIQLTCSVGYSCFYGDHDNESLTWKKVFTIADACAYTVKYSGKNAWLGVEDIHTAPLKNRDFSPETIRTLLKNGQLVIRTCVPETQLRWSAN